MIKKTIFLVLIYSNCIAQIDATSPNLVREIEWFMDTVKTKNDSTFTQYLVYVLYANKSKTEDSNEETCFTISYIHDSHQYSYLKQGRSQYYFKLSDEIVLVRMDNIEPDSLLFRNINLIVIKKGYQILDIHERVKIVQKLFPSEIGLSTGTPEGMVVCTSKNGWKRTYYDNSDEILQEHSIFRPVSENMEVEYRKID